jgi:hypothetical protein
LALQSEGGGVEALQVRSTQEVPAAQASLQPLQLASVPNGLQVPPQHLLPLAQASPQPLQLASVPNGLQVPLQFAVPFGQFSHVHASRL